MKINNYELDKEQMNIVTSNNKYILVVAGAGCGKTLTILGKIKYLVQYKNISPKDILCISYTNASCKSLEDKLREINIFDVDVFTFHKLSIEILKLNNYDYSLCNEDFLYDVIHEYLFVDAIKSKQHMKYILSFFNKIYINEDLYLKTLIDNNLDYYNKLIFSFIKIFKAKGYSTNHFLSIIKSNKINILFNIKFKYFLITVINIYLKYMNDLDDNNYLDFDDLISNANSCVLNKTYPQYKYIIIDEYQDSSYSRFSLIKSLVFKCNSSLMVVGDDFQSIYKFSGCSLDLFINFSNYFNNAVTYKIQTTYRNSLELVTTAGEFIMKNKFQIRKKLVSNKRLDNPIKIIYFKDKKKCLEKLILEIYDKYGNDILILGRNNFDIKFYLSDNFSIENNKIIYVKNNDIDISYLTVHKSKGLEANNVIVINLENTYYGFPNKKQNNKYLKCLNINTEKFLYAEERRLFYVAITRTKNYCYLLSPIFNKSIFVNEIKKIAKIKPIIK